MQCQNDLAEPGAVALARDAVKRGCAALEAGDATLALRWLARARRLAPRDHAILFLLAAATGLADPIRALALLDTLLLDAPDHADAYALRVALLYRERRHREAAQQLCTLLRKLPAPDSDDFRDLANRVCHTARAPGWIGVSATGALLGTLERCDILLDGRQHAVMSPFLRTRLLRARVLRAVLNGRPLLGSPINLRARRSARKRAPRAPARPAAKADCNAWRAGQRSGAILLVTHQAGGGVERQIVSRAHDIRAQGLRAIVMRPQEGTPPRTSLCDGAGAAVFAFREDQVSDIVDLLRAEGCLAVEYHHWAEHAPAIRDLPLELGLPYRAILHDYAPICPRVTLCGGAFRFCGDPLDVRACEDCIGQHGARIPFDGTVRAMRESQAAFLAGAEAVIVPSQDAAKRLRRHMPMLNPVVEPWENDMELTSGIVGGRPRKGPAHVALVGAIGREKGFDVLLACVTDAARRALDLRFTVVGHTIDDERLMQAGAIFVSGRFEEGEAQAILEEDRADIGFLPSIWPETWCFALSALWQAGLPVLAFDLGAQAERIRATGAGALIPLGLPAQRINDALVRAASIRRHAMIRTHQLA